MSTRKANVVVQTSGLEFVTQELGDELVVYNRATDTAHLLNPQAAAVFRAAADGCSLEDAIDLMGAGTPAQKEAAARLAISELSEAGVVVSRLPRTSRRSLLRTIGAAAAMPMVISVLAPTTASAASNLPLQAPCTFGVDTCALDGICDLGVCCLPINFGDCNTDADCCQNLICEHPPGPGPNPGICKQPLPPVT